MTATRRTRRGGSSAATSSIAISPSNSDTTTLGEASAPAGATKAKAWEVLGISSYPLTNEFSVYGKLGGYNGKLEGPTGDETTNDVTYGAGVRYDFTKHLGVRGEWQRYHDMGGNNVVKTDVDVVSVGVVYRFQ